MSSPFYRLPNSCHWARERAEPLARQQSHLRTACSVVWLAPLTTNDSPGLPSLDHVVGQWWPFRLLLLPPDRLAPFNFNETTAHTPPGSLNLA